MVIMSKRSEGFFEAKCDTMKDRIKTLEFNNAELVVKNKELMERVKELSMRKPMWPKGYRVKRG